MEYSILLLRGKERRSREKLEPYPFLDAKGIGCRDIRNSPGEGGEGNWREVGSPLSRRAHIWTGDPVQIQAASLSPSTLPPCIS